MSVGPPRTLLPVHLHAAACACISLTTFSRTNPCLCRVHGCTGIQKGTDAGGRSVRSTRTGSHNCSCCRCRDTAVSARASLALPPSINHHISHLVVPGLRAVGFVPRYRLRRCLRPPIPLSHSSRPHFLGSRCPLLSPAPVSPFADRSQRRPEPLASLILRAHRPPALAFLSCPRCRRYWRRCCRFFRRLGVPAAFHHPFGY